MKLANPAAPQIEPIVGALRAVGGTRLDATPCSAALTPPPRAARSRAGERLFILLYLTGPASSNLYRELREVVAQTYWSTTGSTTAALRQATVAANRHLFRFNLHADPSSRCYGGLTCAVLYGDDLFILQVGSARVCVLHRNRFECFPPGEELPHLGMGPLADVRLHHTFVIAGDTLLLASPALIQEASSDAIARVLPRAEVQDVLAGLEQVGAEADFAALVVRWASPPATREVPRPSTVSRGKAPARSVPRRVPEPIPEPRARPESLRTPGPGLGEQTVQVARRTGRGIAVAGAWLAGGASVLFRRMLPGPEREAHRRARSPRPIPRENRTVMMSSAIGILVVVAIIVVLADSSFGEETRFQRLIEQAGQEAVLAQAAGGVSEITRPHWEAALEYASTAVAWRPDDAAATSLQAQAQAALDLLNGVVRLNPVQLGDFGPSTGPRRLVIHGQMIFVLDPAMGWGVQLTLNPLGDGVVEEGIPLPFVQKGQRIGEGGVGELVDFAWVDPGGERQTSGLVILEKDGAVVSYDPGWRDEEGAPKLTRSLLGTPPTGTPKVVGSFEGRFYVLDTAADQIWRYEPRGDTYPEQPDRYFVTPPPRSLEDALDMVIDGNIYVLYADGTILKFLLREFQPFDVRGLPGEISQAVALAVDADSNSGMVYVADRGDEADQGSGRVIALGPDGAFHAQFRAEGAFDELEALAVDEMAGRLYVVNGGRLYVASLP